MQTNRSNTGAFVGGAILIAIGLLSLTGQLFRGLNWEFFWPFIIIGFGALLFAAMIAAGPPSAALAIPASIVSGLGLVMLFQNITHHWESMSYFWTLIILFVGAGLYIMGSYAGDVHQKQSGLRVMKVGLILFVIFGAFFEMVFSGFNNILFPVLLIAVGVFLVVSRSGLFGSKNVESSDPLPPVH